MNFWLIIICFGAAFILQYGFAMLQMKSFTKHYGKLRRKGKVAIGKRKGGFMAGAIAMLAVDDEGIIITGSYLSGVTVMARFKELNGLEGKNIVKLVEDDILKYPKQVRKSILEASSNYITIINGGEVKQPESPLNKMAGSVKKLATQK